MDNKQHEQVYEAVKMVHDDLHFFEENPQDFYHESLQDMRVTLVNALNILSKGL